MADWTYHRLCEAFREEKSSNALGKLEPEFEENVSLMLAKLENRASIEADAAKELDGSRKQALALIRLRRHKIIIRSLGAIDGIEPEGMTTKEKEVYSRVKDLCQGEEERIAGALWRKPAAQKGGVHSEAHPSGQSARESVLKRLQIVKEIPAYRGADSVVYGPFKAGETAMLPSSEAEWMLKGGMAQDG
jgi:DNA replication initiation complex subunit (GINS family)